MKQEQESISCAMRYFRALLEQRLFAEYISEELHLSYAQKSSLYQIVVGKVRPTYGIIYFLRDKIAPVKWYYAEQENCPSPIKFDPLHNNYATATRKIFARKKTCGHVFFDILKANRSLTSVCRSHDIQKSVVINYVYMKMGPDKKMRYLCRPTVPFVSTFKDILHPDYWYIFPDELSKEALVDFKDKAYECAKEFKTFRLKQFQSHFYDFLNS